MNRNDNESVIFAVAGKKDLCELERIRMAAFTPVFESFRKILGDTIYEIAQQREDLDQAKLLKSYLEPDSIWKLWKMSLTGKIIGFISIKNDHMTKVGEIGLNAVDPCFTRRGFGSRMYNFAVDEMKKAGMKVATVATGGDPAHTPARQAYRKAGFNVEIPSVWMCRELD